jgi:hypothetical protein
MRGVNALTALTDNDFDGSFGLSRRRHGAIAPDPLLRASFHRSRQALVSGSKQPDDRPIPQ